MGQFQLSDPAPTKASPGTIVSIENLANGETSLQAEDAPSRIAEELALYLNQYRNVRVFFDGRAIDPAEFIKRQHEEQVTVALPRPSVSARATLTIIEWNAHQVKTLTLCDQGGFPLHVVTAGIREPGFFFTAYLCSDHIRELHESGRLALEDLDPGTHAG